MTTAVLAVLPPEQLVRQSTDIAGLCKEIVLKSAMEIQKRKYVKVEGWQSIATAHGCVASSRDVERIEGGFRAIGEVRRVADGALIAQAEGFVGEDEPTWFGGETMVWNRDSRQREKKVLEKRPDYAIRAMAQTRAISRACRSAFAHVVVLMDAGLSTTPAEEVPHGGFDNASDDHQQEERDRQSVANRNAPVVATHVHFGKNKGKAVAELNNRQLAFYRDNFEKQQEEGKRVSDADKALYEAVKARLAPEPPKAVPLAQDEIPMGGDHPNREKLRGELVWNNISEFEFLESAKAQGAVPEKAKNFNSITEESAAKFLEDMENVKTSVEMWREAQK